MKFLTTKIYQKGIIRAFITNAWSTIFESEPNIPGHPIRIKIQITDLPSYRFAGVDNYSDISFILESSEIDNKFKSNSETVNLSTAHYEYFKPKRFNTYLIPIITEFSEKDINNEPIPDIIKMYSLKKIPGDNCQVLLGNDYLAKVNAYTSLKKKEVYNR